MWKGPSNDSWSRVIDMGRGRCSKRRLTGRCRITNAIFLRIELRQFEASLKQGIYIFDGLCKKAKTQAITTGQQQQQQD